jgi:hypothetical protein
MRPVAFGEPLPRGTQLTLVSDDNPDRLFTMVKFCVDRTSDVALALRDSDLNPEKVDLAKIEFCANPGLLDFALIQASETFGSKFRLLIGGNAGPGESLTGTRPASAPPKVWRRQALPSPSSGASVGYIGGRLIKKDSR